MKEKRKRFGSSNVFNSFVFSSSEDGLVGRLLIRVYKLPLVMMLFLTRQSACICGSDVFGINGMPPFILISSVTVCDTVFVLMRSSDPPRWCCGLFFCVCVCLYVFGNSRQIMIVPGTTTTRENNWQQSSRN